MKGYEALAAVQEMDIRFLDEAMEWNGEKGKGRMGIGRKIGLIVAAVLVVFALTGAGLRVFEPDLYARWIMNLSEGETTGEAASEWAEKMLTGPKEMIYEDEAFKIESLGVVRSDQTFILSLLVTVKDKDLIANKDYIYTVAPVLYYFDFYQNGQPVEDISSVGSYGAIYNNYEMPSLAENESLITAITTIETEAVLDQFSLEIDRVNITAINKQTLMAPEDFYSEISMDDVVWTCQLGEINEIGSLLLELDAEISENGVTYHLEKIHITPFNILLDIDGDMVDNSPAQTPPRLDTLSIMMEDGTVATVLMGGSTSFGSGTSDSITEIRTFSEPVVPDKIASIALGGHIIWEKDE